MLFIASLAEKQACAVGGLTCLQQHRQHSLLQQRKQSRAAGQQEALLLQLQLHSQQPAQGCPRWLQQQQQKTDPASASRELSAAEGFAWSRPLAGRAM